MTTEQESAQPIEALKPWRHVSKLSQDKTNRDDDNDTTN